MSTTISAQNNYRALFLSDLHLGSHNCKANRLYRFLQKNNADRIYLVGDIVEGRHLRSWPRPHQDIIQLLAKRSLEGSDLFFIPGNHDSIFRHHLGVFGHLRIVRNYTHICIDGSLLYVTHGDEVDFLPDYLYLWLFTSFERLTKVSLWEGARRLLGWIIKKHTHRFEKKMRKLGHSNIICGHIHFPKISDGYMNIGDWTFHCTAIAEHFDGKFELLYG